MLWNSDEKANDEKREMEETPSEQPPPSYTAGKIVRQTSHVL